MGLVANYNSDSDASVHSEEESEGVAIDPATVTDEPEPLNLRAALPAPKKTKRIVPFQLKLREILERGVPGELEEEDAGRPKRHKQVTKGTSFRDLLPKPKHVDSALGGGLGFGAAGGTGIDLGSGGKSTFPSATNTFESARPAPQAYAASAPEEPTFLMEHQVYRGSAQSAPTSSLPAGFFQPQVLSTGATEESDVAGPSRAPAQDDLLQQAMQEEMYRKNRAGRGADPFRKIEMPAMVEVSQASLTTMARPVDTVNAVQKAFGPQYAAELKRQAGAKPDAKHRRKHQIGSLYHDAKVRELDLFENKASGMKTRMETQGKYGWV